MAELGIGCKGQSLSEDQSARLEDPTAKRAKVIIPVTSGEGRKSSGTRISASRCPLFIRQKIPSTWYRE
jgi:hypothetical protein